MADFDNGLPPEGTTSDGEISAISLSTAESTIAVASEISAITLDTSSVDSEKGNAPQISGVIIDKEPAHPVNTAMFL